MSVCVGSYLIVPTNAFSIFLSTWTWRNFRPESVWVPLECGLHRLLAHRRVLGIVATVCTVAAVTVQSGSKAFAVQLQAPRVTAVTIPLLHRHDLPCATEPSRRRCACIGRKSVSSQHLFQLSKVVQSIFCRLDYRIRKYSRSFS